MKRPKVGTYLLESKGVDGLSEVLTSRVKINTAESVESMLASWGKVGLRLCDPWPHHRFDWIVKFWDHFKSFRSVKVSCWICNSELHSLFARYRSGDSRIKIRRGFTNSPSWTDQNSRISRGAQCGSCCWLLGLGVVLNIIPQTRTGGEYGYPYGSSGHYGGMNHPKSGKYVPSQDPHAPRHE